MRDGLYHKDVFMPRVKFANYNAPVGYTLHARNAAENDRYGTISLPDTLNLIDGELIELSVLGGAIEKMVMRFAYDGYFDLCVVVMLDGLRLVAKTVWLNDRNDLHTTLDKSRYVQYNNRKGDKK